MTLSYRLVETSLGSAAFVAGTRGLRRVYLPGESVRALHARIRRENPGVMEDADLLPDLADAFRRYFTGERVTFRVRLDDADSTDFGRRVRQACRRIPYGRTASYRELAERVGSPQAARAVGQVMRSNPVPIIVPCHRVLRSDGSLGGFSSPGGLKLKQRLLKLEQAAAAL